MYLPEMRPWLVGMPPKPPADECGRAAPLVNDPATRWADDGRMEPAIPEALLVDNEP